MVKQNSVSLGEETKKPLTEEDIKKQIQDEKFKGNCFRMDGKKITENQLKTFVIYIHINPRNNHRKKINSRKYKKIHMTRERIDSKMVLKAMKLSKELDRL